MNILNIDSPLADHPSDLNITLKNHQLAMLKRCIDIEKIENNNFGIMSDKPGTGKTYVVLSLIYQTKISGNTNIIIVPQNIYNQWIISIENFSKKLSYKKFIDYNSILSLYNDPKILMETDVILITSSYYHIVATTLSSLNITINRTFFDEIDSISNIICTNINSNFIWFISASFDKDYIGYYKDKIKDIDNITCKCDDNFIDENIYLDSPVKEYYLCKNIYIDYILNDIISYKELKGLNAMDYTLYNKSFEQSKAKNEKEIIEIILKNRRSIIEFDKFQISEARDKITFYKDFLDNKNTNEDNFLKDINKVHYFIDFKNDILNFISNYNEYTDFYVNEVIEEIVIKEARQDELKTLRAILEDAIEVLYNFSDIEDICNQYYINKVKGASIDNMENNLKKLIIIIKDIYILIHKLKGSDQDEINIFYDKIISIKNYTESITLSISNFDNSQLSFCQIELHNKIIEICDKNIEENNRKVNLIFKRLEENNCCPVCYEEFNNIDKDIYISLNCCHNKICGECIENWYKLNKNCCIFCNTDGINFDMLVSFKREGDCKDCDINQTNQINNNNNNNIIHLNYNKNEYLRKFIIDLKNKNKKVIIFSDYSHIFDYIELICNENDIFFVDLDKGNIKDINNSVNDYKYGNAKILLSNSTLFGCGMNFENSTDIIFVHKMDETIEKQVIGRAQRMGRTSTLNIFYLYYENEVKYNKDKNYYNDYYTDDNKTEELGSYYSEQQYYNLLENIQHLNFDNNVEVFSNIGTNEIAELDKSTTDLNLLQVNELPNESIDINLEELINSLS